MKELTPRVKSLLMLGLTCALALALGRAAEAQAEEKQLPFYLRQNGQTYHYVRESSTTFNSISAKIKEGWYTTRGVYNIGIYCPYHAAAEWRGVPAIDFFDTNPSTGTVADFEEMVSTAHAHGMSVTIYMGLLFVDHQNPLWLKAQRDKRNGLPSREVKIFRWQGQPGELPEFKETASWQESELAGTSYAASWQRPALDLASPEGRKYVESVIKFWLDRGIDGIEFDSPPSFWGGSIEVFRELLVELPKRYTANPKYLIAEGGHASAHNAPWNDQIGFTHVLLSGDDDKRSIVTDVLNGQRSIDDLEQQFVRHIDARRAAGRGVRSVSLYNLEMSAQERAFEAAVLAGNGSYVLIDYEEIYSVMGPEKQRHYDAVFTALARSTAEAPGADRKRLPSTARPESELHYAVLRTSPSRQERALNVYNFGRRPATISVDLTDSGLPDGERAFDLRTQQPASPVEGQRYTVELPGLGYAFLRFGKDPRPAQASTPPAANTLLAHAPRPSANADADTAPGTPPNAGATSEGDPAPKVPQAAPPGRKVGLCTTRAEGSAARWPTAGLFLLGVFAWRRRAARGRAARADTRPALPATA